MSVAVRVARGRRGSRGLGASLIAAAICGVFGVLAACSPREALPLLNDTGITWGGDYPQGNRQNCRAALAPSQAKPTRAAATAHLAGEDIIKYQDCNQGLDARRHAEGGQAAFHYAALDDRGKPLATAGEGRASCVLDQISGLLWEVKMPADGRWGNQGLHDGDDVFTWYDTRPKYNGGSLGDWNDGAAQCAGFVDGQPRTYCNTEEYRNRVNGQGLCGFRDWRLPSRPELESLVHYGRTQPAIHTLYFSGTKNQFYWSASPSAQQSVSAWAVNFQFGYSAAVQRNNARGVRLVRTWEAQP